MYSVQSLIVCYENTNLKKDLPICVINEVKMNFYLKKLHFCSLTLHSKQQVIVCLVGLIALRQNLISMHRFPYSSPVANLSYWEATDLNSQVFLYLV